MTAGAWKKLTDRAIRRMAARRSERLLPMPGDTPTDARVATWAIAPDPVMERAGAVDCTRYLQLELGPDARIAVRAGVARDAARRTVTVARVSRSGLDDAIEMAIRATRSMSSFDLAPGRQDPIISAHAI